jgi:hypothetical protein
MEQSLIPFKDFYSLQEAKVIDPFKLKEPLKNSDTIRVYHGTSDTKTLFQSVIFGLSGGTRANRRYSFEANNNPYGLFVTPVLKTAKEFGDYIIEFHTKISDLEAPVWPNGGYTVQGGMSGTFSDNADRENARQKQKEEVKTSNTIADYIKQSDSPDVAYWLANFAESQALFVGDLNKNSIRAIWVPHDPTRVNSKYTRLDRKQFLKKAEKEGIKTRYNTLVFPNEEQIIKHLQSINKVFEPREDASLSELIIRLKKEYPFLKERADSSIIALLKQNPDFVEQYLWNKRQIEQIKKELKNTKI